jgi:hypothetical protein
MERMSIQSINHQQEKVIITMILTVESEMEWLEMRCSSGECSPILVVVDNFVANLAHRCRVGATIPIYECNNDIDGNQKGCGRCP